MDNNKINRLADQVLKATPTMLQSLACPVCGGGIEVAYTRAGKGAVSLRCTSCLWRIVSDGIPREPPWVQVLGAKFRTAGGPPIAVTSKHAKKKKPSVPA